jgi:hypothetical protein
MKKFNEIRAPKIKKGLRDKKGKLHTVDMKLDGSKLSFRVADEFGSFKTVNAKGLAKMFEGTDVDKFIEEGSFWGQDKMVAKSKKLMGPKTHVRLTREKGGYERATVSKKDKKKIAQLKKDGYKIDPTFAKEEIEEAKSSSGYDLYHKDFSGAMQHAYAHAKKKGYVVSTDDIDSKVAMGPKKPSSGKTNKYILSTQKKNNVHIQVANLDNRRYELNMYIESAMVEGKKPVSQMTPAEKKKDAERRKEYNAYQKSKRNEDVVDEAMNPKDKAKRLKMIKKAVERINKNNAEKAKKDALRMMKDSGMFDESVEITEGKQSYVDQMRDIVAKKSAKKINGVMVDMFTASAVVKVYDAINDTNKAKMDKMTVPAMANVAFKLMKK